MPGSTPNNGTASPSFSANDWFYMKPDCAKIDCSKSENSNAPCCLNKNAVTDLKTHTNEFGAAMMQYNDTKMLYNRELLFTVNMLFGLGLICYYIYVNQSVIKPISMETVNFSKIGNSIGKATSAVTNRLSMRPPTLPTK
jgi:hypothetical protein